MLITIVQRINRGIITTTVYLIDAETGEILAKNFTVKVDDPVRIGRHMINHMLADYPSAIVVADERYLKGVRCKCP